MTNTIAEAFAARVIGWPEKLADDEWFFARLREELVGSLSPCAAFDAIGGMVSWALLQDDPDLLAEAGEFLLTLVRRSDTTEKPPALAGDWQRLADRLTEIGPWGHAQVIQLRRWYRQAGT